jgi:hypothetical protein
MRRTPDHPDESGPGHTDPTNCRPDFDLLGGLPSLLQPCYLTVDQVALALYGVMDAFEVMVLERPHSGFVRGVELGFRCMDGIVIEDRRSSFGSRFLRFFAIADY